jgi:cytochrome c-type biogenesis protein CcmH/NrfF
LAPKDSRIELLRTMLKGITRNRERVAVADAPARRWLLWLNLLVVVVAGGAIIVRRRRSHRQSLTHLGERSNGS